MMQDYNKILDRVYELEGLVLLALSGDNTTSRLPELIYMKAFEITELSMPKTAPKTVPAPMAPTTLPVPPVEATEVPAPLPEAPAPAEDESAEVPEAPETPVPPMPEVSVPAVDTPPEPPVVLAPIAPKSSKRTPSFSLNDHFLFIRELFGGDSEEFNKAMNSLAALESYEEAEEFFIAEYDWDDENETTLSFMNCINKYFNAPDMSK